jgi:hypothetical protein
MIFHYSIAFTIEARLAKRAHFNKMARPLLDEKIQIGDIFGILMPKISPISSCSQPFED